MSPKKMHLPLQNGIIRLFPGDDRNRRGIRTFTKGEVVVMRWSSDSEDQEIAKHNNC